MSSLKLIFLILGTLSLCIGIIGIIVPGLPTTPFLLITAGLYAKSSDRLYQRLVSNRFVGHHIANFQRSNGMSLRSKIISIAIMWAMIALSIIFFIQAIIVKLIVIILGILGTVVMGFIVKTTKV